MAIVPACSPLPRLAVKEMATKDFIRAELRALLEELDREKEPDEVAK